LFFIIELIEFSKAISGHTPSKVTAEVEVAEKGIRSGRGSFGNTTGRMGNELQMRIESSRRKESLLPLERRDP
jgi:hypothetical protein